MGEYIPFSHKEAFAAGIAEPFQHHEMVAAGLADPIGRDDYSAVGGGASDYDTVKVTITNLPSGVKLNAPVRTFLDDDEMASGSISTSGMYRVITYRGEALISGVSGTNPTISGYIHKTASTDVYMIDGDGTMDFSGGGGQ